MTKQKDKRVGWLAELEVGHPVFIADGPNTNWLATVTGGKPYW